MKGERGHWSRSRFLFTVTKVPPFPVRAQTPWAEYVSRDGEEVSPQPEDTGPIASWGHRPPTDLPAGLIGNHDTTAVRVKLGPKETSIFTFSRGCGGSKAFSYLLSHFIPKTTQEVAFYRRENKLLIRNLWLLSSQVKPRRLVGPTSPLYRMVLKISEAPGMCLREPDSPSLTAA